MRTNYARTLSALALAACCTGVAQAQVPGSPIGQLAGLDVKQEIQVGMALAGRVLGAAPLVADPDLQRYVNHVGRWIASQTERPDLPWRFGVIESQGINAFASPGGFILVTRGLYELLENEAQLAGVLAHEIAHVVKRHHVIGMQQKAGINVIASLVAQQTRNQLAQGLIGTGTEIFHRGLDKTDEFEADRMGVALAIRAGYSPFGLVEVLHKLGARSRDDGALALLFKTHPPPEERLEKLSILLTPRMEQLPEGVIPQLAGIQAGAVATQRGPSRAAQQALQPQPSPEQELIQQAAPPARTNRPVRNPPQAAPPKDAVQQLLRGVFGR